MAAKRRLLVAAPPRRRLTLEPPNPYAPCEPADEATDAARWRALLSSARVRVYQTKGFPLAGTSPHDVEMFLAVEFHHGKGAMPITQPGRLLVASFADAIRGRSQT